jgi:IS6 family transposase
LARGRDLHSRRGKWRYLWRAIDANGQLVDFRLTARRDAKAAKAFLRKAIKRVRLHRSVTICTDKAPTYRKVIWDENRRYDPPFESITHIDRKWLNNRIESGHAALKRLLGAAFGATSFECMSGGA